MTYVQGIVLDLGRGWEGDEAWQVTVGPHTVPGAWARLQDCMEREGVCGVREERRWSVAWTSAIPAGLEGRMGRRVKPRRRWNKRGAPRGTDGERSQQQAKPSDLGTQRGWGWAMSSRLTHFDFIGQKMGVAELLLEQRSGLISAVVYVFKL